MGDPLSRTFLERSIVAFAEALASTPATEQSVVDKHYCRRQIRMKREALIDGMVGAADLLQMDHSGRTEP